MIIPIAMGIEITYIQFPSKILEGNWIYAMSIPIAMGIESISYPGFFGIFYKPNRNVNPVILKNGDGKNSLFVIQGTIIFPHSRLSSHSEKKIPHSRLCRSWGIFSSLFLLSLSWGNMIVPFMTHKEFAFPLLAASPPRRGNIPSPFFKMTGLGHTQMEIEMEIQPSTP